MYGGVPCVCLACVVLNALLHCCHDLTLFAAAPLIERASAFRAIHIKCNLTSFVPCLFTILLMDAL